VFARDLSSSPIDHRPFGPLGSNGLGFIHDLPVVAIDHRPCGPLGSNGWVRSTTFRSWLLTIGPSGLLVPMDCSVHDLPVVAIDHRPFGPLGCNGLGSVHDLTVVAIYHRPFGPLGSVGLFCPRPSGRGYLPSAHRASMVLLALRSSLLVQITIFATTPTP